MMSGAGKIDLLEALNSPPAFRPEGVRMVQVSKPRAALSSILPLVASLAILAACQASGSKTAGDNSAAVALLQRVNDNAHTCWIRSKDKDFDRYSVVPELDTQAGKPRILVVEKKAAHGLPKLVIEADGKPAKVAAYGPLLNEPAGNRISADLKRWTSGSTSCTA